MATYPADGEHFTASVRTWLFRQRDAPGSRGGRPFMRKSFLCVTRWSTWSWGGLIMFADVSLLGFAWFSPLLVIGFGGGRWQVRCPIYRIIPRVQTTNIVHHYSYWPRSPGWRGVWVSLLWHYIPSHSPIQFPYCSLEGSHCTQPTPKWWELCSQPCILSSPSVQEILKKIPSVHLSHPLSPSPPHRGLDSLGPWLWFLNKDCSRNPFQNDTVEWERVTLQTPCWELPGWDALLSCTSELGLLWPSSRDVWPFAFREMERVMIGCSYGSRVPVP